MNLKEYQIDKIYILKHRGPSDDPKPRIGPIVATNPVTASKDK